jgi:hypothetical protein
MFEIEDNVTMPARSGGGPTFPFALLQVGQSFLVPDELRQNLQRSANSYRRANPGWQYVTRPVEGGRRIWRTA